MSKDQYNMENGAFQSDLIDVLERIARAQEGMLAIAAEARAERMKLADALKAKLKEPFDGGLK